MYKSLAILFAVLSALLSHSMCALVAYNWCHLKYQGAYLGASAPASVSLLLAIPFLAGIAVCAALSIHFYRAYRREN